jgi:hypothetical protein
MTDPSFTPEEARELLVVYPSRDRADQARARLLQAGVDDADIRIDAASDHVASLRAEMHEELTRAWVVPNAAVAYTKEGARGLAAATLIGSAIGLVVAFVAAIPDFGSTYLTRLVVFAVVGIAFGATVGLVAGPGLGSRRPDESSAAERGVLLRVSHDSPELRALLGDLDPIRIDEVRADDLPIATVATEGEDRLARDTLEDLGAHLQGDDYHADPERTGSER